MGVNIADIIPKKEVDLKDLKGKVVAIDAFNTLYQFLTSIRQMDGTPLMDKKGNVTSHLSGLFYRTINLLQEGIKPVFVFDGQPPELKQAEIEKRRQAKRVAEEKFDKAKLRGDTSSMRKFSSQFVKMTDEIISQSKQLLQAMGVPVIQAPSEGEAEAAVLARKGEVWAAASQDYDALLYGAPFLVRNLTLARRRKTSAGLYVDVKLELIEFQEVLNQLNLDLDQLICLAILVGTDYNPGGVKGLGQKKALEFVQKYEVPVEIFKAVDAHDKYELTFDWQEVFRLFHEYETDGIDNEGLLFRPVDKQAVLDVLLAHDFSQNRILSGLEKLEAFEDAKKQKGLTEFF